MISKEQFLSAGFNNLLALILGVMVSVYMAIVVPNGSWSAQDGFTGMAILGALY